MATEKINKLVLSYSGGLDTSVMLRWIKDHFGCEVVAYCADVGQGDETEGLEDKALKTGASKLYIVDLREEFARDFVFPMLRASAIYECYYLLGTSIARPVIAKKLVEIARTGRRRRCRAWRDRQGQRPGALRVDVCAARAGPEDHRAVAAYRLAVRGPRRHDCLRQRKENSPHRHRREAVLDGSQPRPCQLRGRHPRGPVARALQRHVSPHRLARRRAEPAGVRRNRIRRRQSGRDQRRASRRRQRSSSAPTKSPDATVSAASTWSRTATSGSNRAEFTRRPA